MHKEQKWCYLYNIVLNSMYISNCHYMLHADKHKAYDNYSCMKNLCMTKL